MRSESPAILTLDSASLTTATGGKWVRVSENVWLKHDTEFRLGGSDKVNTRIADKNAQWGSRPGEESPFGTWQPQSKDWQR